MGPPNRCIDLDSLMVVYVMDHDFVSGRLREQEATGLLDPHYLQLLVHLSSWSGTLAIPPGTQGLLIISSQAVMASGYAYEKHVCIYICFCFLVHGV
jgi:hypothetical protein